jgi:hypothetical protein
VTFSYDPKRLPFWLSGIL